MDTSNRNDDSRLQHDRVPSQAQNNDASEPGEDQAAPEAAPAETAPRTSGRTARILSIAVPIVVALVGAFLLGLWLLGDKEPVDVEPRPGSTASTDTGDAPTGHQAATDTGQQATGDETAPGGTESGSGQPDQPATPEQTAAPSDQPTTGATQSAATPTSGGGGSWPSFRGNGRHGIAQEASGLASSWPSSGPRQLWSKDMLGPGHAGAAIANGRVYVLDYNKSARQDVLRCLSLSDGSEIWSQSYSVQIKDNHGISRTVPAVAGGYVVTLGPMGHVMCARADSGEVVWQVDLKKAYGTKIPSWYAGQCPLIDNGKAILAPGGKALMVAVDCATGTVAWETGNPNNWQMTHSSVMPMQLGGRKVYVYTASGGVSGVSTDGKVLWQYSRWKVNTANVPTPVPVGNDRIFLCGGYGAGSMLLSVKGSSPSQVWKIPQNVFGSHQHTPILYQNHLFGVSMDRQLVCLNLQGKRVWSSGHTARFGIGPYLLADGKLYVLSDDGTLVMAQATTSGYNELARAKVVPGPDAWGAMALADGKLVLRDRTKMVCLDVKSP